MDQQSEEEKRKQTPWYKKWWGILIILGIGFVIANLVFGGGYLFNQWMGGEPSPYTREVIRGNAYKPLPGSSPGYSPGYSPGMYSRGARPRYQSRRSPGSSSSSSSSGNTSDLVDAASSFADFARQFRQQVETNRRGSW